MKVEKWVLAEAGRGELGIACEQGSTESLLECRILASSIPEA